MRRRNTRLADGKWYKYNLFRSPKIINNAFDQIFWKLQKIIENYVSILIDILSLQCTNYKIDLLIHFSVVLIGN